MADTATLDQYRQSELLKLGRSLVSDLELDSVLDSVLSLARELTDAKYAALGVISSDGSRLERFITDGIDEATQKRIGKLPQGRGLLGLLINEPHPIRLNEISEHPASSGFPPNHPPMKTFLGVPILIRGRVYGNLYLTEKATGAFTVEDEEATVTLASWAAIAIDNAHSVERDRLQQSITSSELERTRWARELHDETLQGLAALKVSLSAAVATKDTVHLMRAAEGAVEQLNIEIQNLRGLITDLRPAALDELGLFPAIDDLLARTVERTGLEIETKIDPLAQRQIETTGKTLESTVYRLLQEALTNIAKHARAEQVAVEIVFTDPDIVKISIRDDGVGFDTESRPTGLGLVGMRERIELANGELSIQSRPKFGTTVSVRLRMGTAT